jgi:hypothetical protein
LNISKAVNRPQAKNHFIIFNWDFPLFPALPHSRIIKYVSPLFNFKELLKSQAFTFLLAICENKLIFNH